jgi:hypothetical protein
MGRVAVETQMGWGPGEGKAPRNASQEELVCTFFFFESGSCTETMNWERRWDRPMRCLRTNYQRIAGAGSMAGAR